MWGSCPQPSVTACLLPNFVFRVGVGLRLITRAKSVAKVRRKQSYRLCRRRVTRNNSNRKSTRRSLKLVVMGSFVSSVFCDKEKHPKTDI